jgi:peptide deformylase
MALLPILRYPDERLHTVAAPVESFNGEIRRLIEDMAQTMYAAPGVGLAATQVDVHKRVIVIDITETRDQLLVLVNPTILETRGISDFEEGCLSVPGIFEKIERAEWIKVRALDKGAQPFELEASGLLSVCIQHEMDHLEGKVFVEYLSRLKQTRILARIKKQEKQQRRAL